MASPTSKIEVEFVPAATYKKHEAKQQASWMSRIISFPCVCVRMTFRCLEKIYNTALLILDVHLFSPRITDVNLLRPFSRCINRAPDIVEVATLAERYHITSHPEVMTEILKHHRNDLNGIFFGGRVMTTIVDFFQELYPDEKVTREDFILSCNPQNLQRYLEVLNTFLNPMQVTKNSGKIQSIAAEEIAKWEQIANLKGRINITEATKTFATTVIFKLLFGDTGPCDDIDKIIKALDSLNQYLVGQYALGKNFAGVVQFNSDKKIMLDVLRDGVERVLNIPDDPNADSMIKNMQKDPSFTPLQIRIMVITMLMAGQETTAAVLSYAIWQLARAQNHKYQEDIREEIKQKGYDPFKANQNIILTTVENVLCEALRLHPQYVISRDAGEDLECVIKDKETKEVIKTHSIAKGEGVNPCPYFAARNPETFPDPEVFNPKRHHGITTSLSWLPFSDGVEKCPGQWLAKNEIRIFLAQLISKFHIRTEQEADIGQKGLLTLKLKEDVLISLEASAKM